MAGNIYCIRNTINEKVYVGKTYGPIEKLWQTHLKDHTKTRVEKRPLYDAMKKYGAKNFYIELLEEVTDGDLDERESYWIEQLDAYHNGYNATRGGDGSVLYNSEDFVSDYKDGMLIDEIAEKYGCNKETVSRHLENSGVDTRANSTAKRSSAVHQYTKDGKYLRTHPSRSAAARYVIENDELTCTEKMLTTHICNVVNGKRKTA